MIGTMKIAVRIGVVIGAVSLLAGCPSLRPPVLDVSPTALSFSETVPSATLTLSNAGGGVLDWDVSSLPAWLVATPDSGSTSGSQVLQLTTVPSALAPGTIQSEILISSNAGTRSVAVAASTPIPPVIEVAPQELPFGGSTTVLTFEIRNIGSGSLDWTITTDLPAAFNIGPRSGSTVSGAAGTITVTLDRDALGDGTHTGTITVTSNGGDPATVGVSASVQALGLSPTVLDFGNQLIQLPFSIRNNGDTSLNWTINAADLAALPWIALEPATLSGTLNAGQSHEVLVSANRDGLPTGVTAGTLPIVSTQGTETLTLRIEGPDPELLVTPAALDFASTTDTLPLTVQNTGTGTLTWTIQEGVSDSGSFTPADIPWLSVTPGSGATPAGQAAGVSVSVDRTQSTPQPDDPHVAHLRISSADGQQAIVEVSQLTLPPTLRVLPLSLDFDTTYVTRRLAIWNGGLGVVNWAILQPAAEWPGWVQSVTPTSGSVTGEETQMVTITIDRSGFAPADTDYAWVFEVTGTDGGGTPIEPRTVTAIMNVARTPQISIDTGYADFLPPYTPYVPFGQTQGVKTATFTITNTGTGNLTWSISNFAEFPEWLTVSPQTLTLEPNQSTTVTVRVDASNLSYGNEDAFIVVASNDPGNREILVRVELQVPKRVVILVRPSEVALGKTGISGSFEVANGGDPGTSLKFSVSGNKAWVFSNPEYPYQYGTSEGTESLIKDWQPVDVSINRSKLEGTGASAILTVKAYDESNQEIPTDLVAWQEVRVSAEAAPLSFQGAHGRTRIPGLVRFVTLMRDIIYQAIPLAPEVVSDYTPAFTISEKDIPIEEAESSKFLTSGRDLNTGLVILLDYSNSMLAAAQQVSDPSISGAPNPLQALYELCIGQLISELPDSFKATIMVFYDRSQPTRLIKPDAGPVFTADKVLLDARLRSINIQDNGATELLPAIEDAALRILAYDQDKFFIPFDEVDVRAILCVTDGRLTTPPGQVRDTADYLYDRFVRVFPIGWGSQIRHETLARLAADTGGHYYQTDSEDTGTVDPNGIPLRLPVVSELMGWCETLPAALDPCDESFIDDLQSQAVLSYVSLREDAPIKVRVDGAFDDPNDTGACLDNQRTISGYFEQQDFDFGLILGDARLGQISLPNTSIVNRAARVTVRAEYIPRNVDSFRFRISAPHGFTVLKAPNLAGGLVEDWDLNNPAPNEFTLTRPAGVPMLPYASFGDMLYLDFDELPPGTSSFRVNFDVLAPVYAAGDFSEKYFTYPDSVVVNSGGVKAPAFPTPLVAVTNPPSSNYVLNFGSTTSVATVRVENFGGSHVPTGVWLRWFLLDFPQYLGVNAMEGSLASTLDSDTLSFTLDRSAEAGTYTGTAQILFDTYLLGAPPQLLTLTVLATILPPVLEVTSPHFDPMTTLLRFGESSSSLDIAIQNTGQSTLHWLVDTSAFPGWLSVSPATGAVSGGATNVATVGVNRAIMPPGGYGHDFTVSSENGSVTVTVQVTVP